MALMPTPRQSAEPRESPDDRSGGPGEHTNNANWKARFAWPAFRNRHADERWSIFNYFLDYARAYLPDEGDVSSEEDLSYEMDPDTGARAGAILRIPEGLEEEMIVVWAEARRKYTRRNLDHMSIMLSTWRTARMHNMAPSALRAFYDTNKKRIRTLAGPYVPMKDRPDGFPWHEAVPRDPEGLLEWIPDWGQPGCAEFMGWAGEGNSASEAEAL